jgi:hypothetical protein
MGYATVQKLKRKGTKSVGIKGGIEGFFQGKTVRIGRRLQQ